MPFSHEGRITGGDGNTGHSNFREALENMHQKYMAQADALPQTNPVRVRAVDTSGQNLFETLRKLAPPDPASISRIIEEYRAQGNNLIPLFVEAPGEWEMLQNTMDSLCLQRGIPLPVTRYKPEYRHVGVYAPDVFAQSQKEQDALSPEERITKTENLISHITNETQVTYTDGYGKVVKTVYSILCGPRLCGSLSADGQTCAHPARLVGFTERPREWRDNFGWVARTSPFLLGHVPKDGEEVWGPVFDRNQSGDLVQLREYDKSECVVYARVEGDF